MNIFEILGLKADHRENSKKTTQLVKHFDEVTEKNKTGKSYGVQVKKDGVCSLLLVLDGKCSIFSRTSKKFTNVYRLEQTLQKLQLPNGVYFGEITCDMPDVYLEMLSGVTSPNRVKPLDYDQAVIAANLTFNFFDGITINEFIIGESSRPYHERWETMFDRVEYGYFKFLGTADCKHVVALVYHEVESEQQMQTMSDDYIEQGEEGIIIADLNAGWVAGHKGWRKMKLVRGVDYDLRCIGYEEGKGKQKGEVANLIFNWKGGKTVKCSLGKGWTRQMAADMLKELRFNEQGNSPVVPSVLGCIFQVYALEESSKGKLRLAKCGEQRHDKDEADV